MVRSGRAPWLGTFWSSPGRWTDLSKHRHGFKPSNCDWCPRTSAGAVGKGTRSSRLCSAGTWDEGLTRPLGILAGPWRGFRARKVLPRSRGRLMSSWLLAALSAFATSSWTQLQASAQSSVWKQCQWPLLSSWEREWNDMRFSQALGRRPQEPPRAQVSALNLIQLCNSNSRNASDSPSGCPQARAALPALSSREALLSRLPKSLPRCWSSFLGC